MEPRRRRNSKLGNEEKEKLVDYEEEQEAEQSTASGESHIQTSLIEQVAGKPEFQATQPEDGFTLMEINLRTMMKRLSNDIVEYQ